MSEAEVLVGHVLDVLATLPEESVSCVVTSPPYWSLRKYDAPDVVWGGNPGCEHAWGDIVMGGESYSGEVRWEHGDAGRLYQKDGGSHAITRAEKPEAWQKHTPRGCFCSRCGAFRGQYGLEPTPELYVEHTLDVLRAIRRVLRPDGCVWWNIGDGYAAGKTGRTDQESLPRPRGGSYNVDHGFSRSAPPGLKPKDLVLMPFRVALAAQADGWWVRSVIVWSKPNCMPESAGDRPTESHEYILLLTKNGAAPLYWYHPQTGEMSGVEPRKRGRWEEGRDWDYDKRGREITRWRGVPYWYDQEAVREAAEYGRRSSFRSPRYQDNHAHTNSDMDYPTETNMGGDVSGRNMRSVWEFPTAQTPEAHFATFPEELPRRCIEASCPREICAKCGTARVRLVETDTPQHEGYDRTEHPPNAGRLAAKRDLLRAQGRSHDNPFECETTGWTSCACAEPDYQPGTVLDPFAGIGTTGVVAKRLGRRFIGIELSEKYAGMARDKIRLWWRRTELVAPEPAAGQGRML